MSGRDPLERAEVEAQKIARLLAGAMPTGWGFMLWLGTRGAGGYSTYVSNFARDDAIRCVEEWYQRVRGAPFESIDVREECWTCGAREDLLEARGSLRRVALCRGCASTLQEPGR